MLQVEEALAAVLSAASPARAAPRDVPLHEALGLVLAEDVRAHDPLPPFRASIKVCRPPSLPHSFGPFPRLWADEDRVSLSLPLLLRIEQREIHKRNQIR